MSESTDSPLSEEELEAKEHRRRQVRQAARRYRARKKAESEPKQDQEVNPLDAETDRLIMRFIRFRAAGQTSNSKRPLSRSSQEEYRRDIVAFTLDLDVPLLDATQDHVAQWLEENTRNPKDPNDPRPWSRRTAHRKRSSLSNFFDWAVDEGLITTSPLRRIKPPPFQRNTFQAFEKDRLEHLFEHIETKIAVAEPHQAMIYIMDACFFRIAFHWGLRVSEVTNLSYDRIHIVKGEYRVEVVRKGDKSQEFPMGGVVLDTFMRWHNVRQEFSPDARHATFVFVHPHRRKRVSRRRAGMRLRKLATDAGFTQDEIRRLSPHKLRHSFARYRLVEKGDPITLVRDLLGHADVSVTAQYLDMGEAARLDALRDSNRND